MFISVRAHSNPAYQQVQICKSVRVGKTVRQKVVRHVGIAKKENISELIRLKELALNIKTEMENVEPPDHLKNTLPKEECCCSLMNVKEKSRYVEGFHDIFGKIFRQVGFDTILSQDQSEILLDVVLARLACPSSK